MNATAVILTMHKDGKTFHLTLPIDGRMAWNVDESAEGVPVEEFFDINFHIEVTEIRVVVD